jgi:putative transposase
MTAPDSLPLRAAIEANLASASPDPLLAMVKSFADALMSAKAEADAACNAEYGQVSDERVNQRTATAPGSGTPAPAPSNSPSQSCGRAATSRPGCSGRRRAEQALISVVATAYLPGVSTRRVEKLAQTLGVTQLSKSQVSEMARHLDDRVAEFRNRPLDQGPTPSSGWTR